MKGTCSSITRQVSGIIYIDVIVFLQAIRDYIAIVVVVVVVVICVCVCCIFIVL